jgi:hypothetical protein
LRRNGSSVEICYDPTETLVAANIGWHIGIEEQRVNVLIDVLSSAEEREVVPVASDEERQVLDARQPISRRTYAYKHERYAAEAIARRCEISALIRAARALGGKTVV